MRLKMEPNCMLSYSDSIRVNFLYDIWVFPFIFRD
jgi:hypothetical protein